MSFHKCGFCDQVFEFRGEYQETPKGCKNKGRGCCDLHEVAAPASADAVGETAATAAAPHPSATMPPDLAAILASVGVVPEATETPVAPASNEPAPRNADADTVSTIDRVDEAPRSEAPVAKQIVATNIEPFTVGYLVGGLYRISRVDGKVSGSSSDWYTAQTLSGVEVKVRRCLARNKQEAPARSALKAMLDRLAVTGVPLILWTHEEGGAIVEVSEAPKGQSLEEWARGRELTRAVIEKIVDRVARILRRLQTDQTGFVVHRDINPRSVFIREEAGSLSVSLGQWENGLVVTGHTVRRIDDGGMEYLPPEAVGCHEIEFDARAKKWDWWCLGRTLQEIILKAHVFTKLSGVNISERVIRDIMLGKREYAPGLVELMDPSLDAGVKTLLEGLLSANVDARWSDAAVEKWVNGEHVESRYSIGALDAVFVIAGRPYSLAEAAKHILATDTPSGAIAHAFGDDGSLAKFIKKQGGHLLNEAIDAGENIAKLKLPFDVGVHGTHWKEQIGAATALGRVAGNTGSLTIGGKVIDRAWLASLFKDRLNPKDIKAAYVGIWTITDEAVVEHVRAAGFPETAAALESTGKILRYLARVSADNGILVDVRDSNVIVKVVQVATKEPSDLIREGAALRAEFPVSNQAFVQSLLVNEVSEPEVAAFLLLGADAVERFQFVSKAQHAAELVKTTLANGAAVVHAASYRTLLAPLKLAPWTFGGFLSWVLFTGTGAFLVADAMGDALNPTPYAIAIAVLLIAKIVGWLGARFWLKAVCPAAKPLKFFGLVKTVRDNSTLRGSAKPKQSRSELIAQVEAINAELDRVSLPGTDVPKLSIPHATTVWCVASMHFVALAAAVCFAYFNATPRSLIGSIRHNITGQQAVALSSTKAKEVQPAGTAPSVNFFGPTAEQLQAAALKLLDEKIKLPANLEPSGKLAEIAKHPSLPNTYTVAVPCKATGDLFDEVSRDQLLRSVGLSPEQVTVALETLKQSGEQNAPHLNAGGSFVRKSHAAGEETTYRFSFTGKEGAKGWTFDLDPNPVGATSTGGQPLGAFQGTVLIEGTPQYAAAVKSLLDSSRSAVEKAKAAKAEVEARTRFAAVQPGARYEGILRANSRSAATEVQLHWETLRFGGEQVTGWIIFVERPWVDRYFTGRATVDASGNTTANLTIGKGWGSEMEQGTEAWDPDRSYELTLTISPDGKMVSKGSQTFDLTATRLPQDANKRELPSDLEDLRARAIGGDRIAAAELGIAYDLGNGVKKNVFAATRWYERAYNLGDMDIRVNTARNILTGALLWRNVEFALKMLTDLDNKGAARAADQLGVLYSQGLYGVSADKNRARSYFKRAAERGNVNGMFNYGLNLVKEDGEYERKIGAEWLHKAADAGHAKAAEVYALCLESGLGVPANKKEAERYRKLSSKAN